MGEIPEDLGVRVEAVLFAAGHPLSVRELAATLGVEDTTALQSALRALQKSYAGRTSAIELAHVGDRYTLQLREAYLEAARPVTPTELPPRTIKALTLIAYHQPLLQSQLVKMLGDSSYAEVARLRSAGLIRAEPKGSTLELATTRAFAEYFGLASTKPEEIRRILEQKLGVPAPPPPSAPSALPASPAEPVSEAPPGDDGASSRALVEGLGTG
ncbi:MAG TPA: SMC-Scp complex subunit ScpB [Thermoplasmata archaeon]|nr:SMC-Scp complex subunit ScpB [Thermoplasmata archaeon]